MFDSLRNRYKMRLWCSNSECKGKRGNQIDRRAVVCGKCGNTWDGMAMPEQQKVLIKEKNTVIRKI